MKVKQEDKNRLYAMFNGTSSDDGNGDVESYENWLERQLLSRLDLDGCYMWFDPSKVMPDMKHIKKRTQFLLLGHYRIREKRGESLYVVSRLCDYFDDDTVLFDLPNRFVLEGWQPIEP